MITIISPAKSQDFTKLELEYDLSQPIFKKEITGIINKLKHYECDEIQKLMKISPKLSNDVFNMHSEFESTKFDDTNSKPAIFTFNGDVYKSLDAHTLDKNTIEYAQNHLLTLSGLYGVIRPLDLIQAYRLEMGTKIKIQEIVLYKYWQDKVTAKIDELISTHSNKTIINLASNEYSQAVDKKILKANWLDIDFKEDKNGTFKTIGIHAKRARGLMSRYIMTNEINNTEDIKNFNVSGYEFNQSLSQSNHFCFTR